MSNRPNAKENIIDFAEKIVVTQGIKELSFDSLAKAANISRGGILYHFESKEILIQAMLERLISRFEALMEQEMAVDREEQGKFTRAFAKATFRMDSETSAVFSALIAAISYQPDLLMPIRARWEAWQQRSEAELDKATAAVVRMASHALWLNGIFGMNNYSPEEQDAIVAKLVSLTLEKKTDQK